MRILNSTSLLRRANHKKFKESRPVMNSIMYNQNWLIITGYN